MLVLSVSSHPVVAAIIGVLAIVCTIGPLLALLVATLLDW
jgi:hypothetical protein